jgi:acyl dehydratase
MGNATDELYFDDLRVGDHETHGPYRVEDAEMREFARRWDPLPIHVDDAAAARSAHGGIIASGIYTIAVKQRLLANRVRWRSAVIGAAGYEGLTFPRPVRAGDELYFDWEITATRVSRTKPDRGIVTFRMRMLNQRRETVLDYTDTVVMARRRP